MWSILIAILSIFAPIIPMIIFLIQTVKFTSLADENKQIEFDLEIKLRTLIPKKIESELRKNTQVNNDIINKVVNQYKKVFYSLCFYLVFWIGYIVYIILKFMSLINFENAGIQLTTEQLGAHWGTWLMNIMVMWILIINPICKSFGIMSRVIYAGEAAWKFINNMYDKLNKFLIKWIEKVIIFIFSFIVIYMVINIWYIILTYLGIPVTFYTILPILLVYQYRIIKLLSKLLVPIIKRIFRQRKIYNVIIKEIIENSTYLCLIGIYSYSIYVNKNNNSFPIAASILFLIDTYVKQAIAIENKRNILIQEENNKDLLN